MEETLLPQQQESGAQTLAYDDWFKEQVQIGISQIKRGEFIEEEKMGALVKRLRQS